MSIARPKPFGRAVEQPALQVLLGRPGDGVHQDVQPPPVLGDALEQRLQLARLRDVERHEDGRIQRPRQRLDVGLGLLVEVGDRQLGAQLAEGARAAVGDGVLVGDAHHERLLVLENGTGDFQSHRFSRRVKMEVLSIVRAKAANMRARRSPPPQGEVGQGDG